MPGTILENLSGRKLAILVAVLLLIQLACFLVGLIAPKPARSQAIYARTCLDPHPSNTTWITKDNCRPVDLKQAQQGLTADQIVFVISMPLGNLDFSRWQQNLIGVLMFEIGYPGDNFPLEFIVELTIDARLAAADKAGAAGRSAWRALAAAEEKRYMECALDAAGGASLLGYPFACSMVPLFELGSLHHDFYLLNVRFPYSKEGGTNVDLPQLSELVLHMIHMNGGYMKVWAGLKSAFLPLVGGVMWWFWRRVHMLARTPALLERMLLALGATLALLDLPLEYLTLHFYMPYMLLVSDIRQGVFYAMLLSFWLVFAGEHMLIQDHGEKNSLRLYWKHLSTIAIGCLSLLVFDLCERGIQLINPFYSIWVTPIGANLALSFIILAGLSATLYLIFLCYMVWRVFRNISIKRTSLPSMSQARRLHYEGIIYRFNFLMLATVACAAVTVVSFILSQVAEGQMNWDDGVDVEVDSVLHTGVYGMWNVYICGMMVLYAPSHKRWPEEGGRAAGGEEEEAVEFSRLAEGANEISALTSFASKASIE